MMKEHLVSQPSCHSLEAAIDSTTPIFSGSRHSRKAKEQVPRPREARLEEDRLQENERESNDLESKKKTGRENRQSRKVFRATEVKKLIGDVNRKKLINEEGFRTTTGSLAPDRQLTYNS